jgi:hypothetical protein
VLVKIMGARGSGGGAGPINYLLGENRDRENARLLRGDADRTAMLIDSLSFRQKYVSGVLSFEEPDITEDQKQQIMDSFQQALLPDMGERTNWLWVEHKDKNRLELNFVIPTVDLESGKRVQPYYHRADLNRVDAWKSLTNDVYRFTDPNDPAKAQTLTLRTNESADRKSFKAAIDDYTSQLFVSGQVNNRDELITAVEQHGLTATRKTKTSVTFTHNENGQKFRMKGAFYGEHFRSREAIQSADRGRDRETESAREERISANRERLARAVAIKRQEIERRYGSAQPTDDQKLREHANEVERRIEMECGWPDYPDYVERDGHRWMAYSRAELDFYKPVSGIADRDLQLWSVDVCRGDAYELKRREISQHRNHNKSETVDDRIRNDATRCTTETDATIYRFRGANKQRVEQYKSSVEQRNNETKRAIERIRDVGQRYGRFAQKSTERAREFVERAEKNNRAIEPAHRRHEHLLESIRGRVIDQRKGRSRSVYPRR